MPTPPFVAYRKYEKTEKYTLPTILANVFCFFCCDHKSSWSSFCSLCPFRTAFSSRKNVVQFLPNTSDHTSNKVQNKLHPCIPQNHLSALVCINSCTVFLSSWPQTLSSSFSAFSAAPLKIIRIIRNYELKRHF